MTEKNVVFSWESNSNPSTGRKKKKRVLMVLEKTTTIMLAFSCLL